MYEKYWLYQALEKETSKIEFLYSVLIEDDKNWNYPIITSSLINSLTSLCWQYIKLIFK